MQTLIITKKEIAKVLTPAVANNTVEKAFRAYGMGQIDMPSKSYITFPKGEYALHARIYSRAGV